MSLADELFAELPDSIPLGDRLPENLRAKFGDRLHIWRIETSQFLEIYEDVGEATDSAGFLRFAAKVLSISLGDENGPGMFANDRGLAWLHRQPHLLTSIAEFAFQFMGLDSITQKKA